MPNLVIFPSASLQKIARHGHLVSACAFSLVGYEIPLVTQLYISFSIGYRHKWFEAYFSTSGGSCIKASYLLLMISERVVVSLPQEMFIQLTQRSIS